MSTFILDKAVIDSIVWLLLRDSKNYYGKSILSRTTHRNYERTNATQEEKNQLGRTLWNINLKATQQRYPNDTNGNRPGPIEFQDDHVFYYWYEEPDYSGCKMSFENIGTLLYNSNVGEHDEDDERLWDLIEWAQGRIACDILEAKASCDRGHGFDQDIATLTVF